MSLKYQEAFREGLISHKSDCDLCYPCFMPSVEHKLLTCCSFSLFNSHL